jgi:hypothetical protein
MPRIYVLHENDEWVTPLRDAFRARGLPFIEWFLATGTVDLATMPPAGVFYNRMSASSHTREHRYGPEYAAAVLSWLERHGRRVLNGPRALTLEVSKVAQYAVLEAGGVRTPRTVAVVGRDEIIGAARGLPLPFITKHNRAGKGLGVRLFRDYDALARYVESDAFEPSIDGITLLQEYIDAPEPCITRVEFVGGRFLYAVRVDTSQGFELCPADACRVSVDNDDFCPAGDAADSLFRILEGFEHPLVERYETVLAANDIHIAGVEFIDDRDGVSYTYDINTNTNYNSEAEALAGCSGMGAIAEYLGGELAKVSPN